MTAAFDPAAYVAHAERLGYRFAFMPPCMTLANAGAIAAPRGALYTMEPDTAADLPCPDSEGRRALLDWCRAHRCFGAPRPE